MRIRLAVYSSFAVKWLIRDWRGCVSSIQSWISAWRWWRRIPSSPIGWRTASSLSPQGTRLYARSALSGAADAGVQPAAVAAGGGEWPAALWQLPLLSIQAIYKEKGRIGGAGPTWAG